MFLCILKTCGHLIRVYPNNLPEFTRENNFSDTVNVFTRASRSLFTVL